MGCCSVHTWKLAPCQPCHSLGLHIHSLCCWGGAGKGAGELGKMLFAGFLQSAASVRSEPQSTELQLALDNCLNLSLIKTAAQGTAAVSGRYV